VKRKILQVALDVLELERAVEIGRECVEAGADWLEAGTPLIKSEGMQAVRALNEAFVGSGAGGGAGGGAGVKMRGGVKIVADMKTTDTGAVEVEMAAKSGASVVSLLALADDAVIEEAVKSARKYGVEIMADLMNAVEPVARAKELAAKGVDFICVHVGIDQQMRGMDALSLLKEVAAAVVSTSTPSPSTQLAVAGGVDAETAAEAVRLGADVVIVGGNIIRSANVREATKKIREGLDLGAEAGKDLGAEVGKDLGEGGKEEKTRDDQIFELLSQVSTANISDAMHRKGVMRGIKPVFEVGGEGGEGEGEGAGAKLVGKAVTVQTFEGDWAKPVEATDVAAAGEVIVVYAGSKEVAVWGELASWSCKQKGIAGVVVDGAVRDVAEIRGLGFPVFAKFVVPNAGEPKGFGEINAEINCGGEEVRNGDWVVGDRDGVVVVPKEQAYEIARRAKEVWKSEERVRAEIKRGKTLSQVLELCKWEKRFSV